MTHILVVEDEVAIAEGLRFNFEQEGFQVTVREDGQSALAVLQDEANPVDLVILDLMLPGMSGYETCESIRKFNTVVPILILSARTLSEDKMRAFDCGTDQYMTKPFALPELLSRVRNLLDRRQALAAANLEGKLISPKLDPRDTRFQFGQVTVNYLTFQVHVGDRTHNLTTLEMQLLRYFIEREGQVLSRSQILEKVWAQSPDVTTRTVDNFVLRLRRVIEPDPAKPLYILSVRGTGYRFVRTPEDASHYLV
jgi:two-component system, OmpR family, alkaline phosphatase synthesis response regulator PhoP